MEEEEREKRGEEKEDEEEEEEGTTLFKTRVRTSDDGKVMRGAFA